MLKAMVAKKGIDFIIKKVIKAKEINKLRKYVEEKNELDIQVEQLQKTVSKQGKYIEEMEKDIAMLKKNSHPAKDFVCLGCGCEAKRK
mgnify:CR=1 FL=1